MTPRGVLWWDFDGTLVSRPHMWTEVAMRVLDDQAPRHGVTHEDLTAHVTTGLPWHRADHAHPDLSTADLWWEAVYQRYAVVFTAVGHASAATPAAFQALRDDILDATRYTIFEDVIPVLQRAGSLGWRNLIVSNHVPELASLVGALGLTSFFEAIVSSGVVGYEKPHPRLFEDALRHTGSDRPIWMIGDNPAADCAPVCGMGHQAVLVRSAVAGAFEREADDLIRALEVIEASG